MHERGFFAAHEGARALLDADVKIEPRAQDVVPEKSRGLCFGNRGEHAFDGQRVFRADVDDALAGADGVAGDGHAF